MEKQHRNLTASFVAHHMYAKIVDNPEFEPKAIIREIEEKYRYTISYNKAYRAKLKALETRFGTYKASYDNLPCLFAVICQRNVGSYYDLRHYPSIKTSIVVQ